MSVQAAFINILESSAITITSEQAALPSYRLYDRLLGLFWQATSTANQTVWIDQGTILNQPVDTLIIPAGHNLSGCAIQWQYSSDNSLWYDMIGSWTQPDGALILKSAAAQTKRYWQVIISGCAAPAQVSEIFLTDMNVFTAQPVYDGAEFGKKRNVIRLETPGGKAIFQVKGPGRRLLTYNIPNIASAELPTFQAWDDAFQMAKPFFFQDHLGNQFFAEFVNEPRFKPGAADFTALTFTVQEII